MTRTGSTGTPTTSRPTASLWPLPRRRASPTRSISRRSRNPPPRIRGDDGRGGRGHARGDHCHRGRARGPRVRHDDELIAAVVDCAPFVDAKYDALAAHASQTEDIFFLRLGRELFDRFFGQEAFVRAVDRTGAPVPEADLFARPALSSARRSPPVPPAERGRSRQHTSAPSSTPNASVASGAAQESSKPKRPPFTERRNPTSVEAAKPAPSSEVPTRRQATTATATTRPLTAWRPKEHADGGDVAVTRVPQVGVDARGDAQEHSAQHDEGVRGRAVGAPARPEHGRKTGGAGPRRRPRERYWPYQYYGARSPPDVPPGQRRNSSMTAAMSASPRPRPSSAS